MGFHLMYELGRERHARLLSEAERERRVARVRQRTKAPARPGRFARAVALVQAALAQRPEMRRLP